VALGVALVVLVFQVRGLSRRAFEDAAVGFDVVVGGVQTPPMTTVMSTVLHVGAPVDTIPVEAYEDLRKDPRVAHAVPYVVGDTYRGHRVVGTLAEFFETATDASRRPLSKRVTGRVFADGDEFEAVVGARVASRTGLGVGSTFRVTHGLDAGGEGHEHEDEWTVVGVLEPTGTPHDRAIYITLESFFHVKGHEAPPDAKEGAHEGGLDDDSKVWAVSSVVVRLRSPALRTGFLQDFRRRKDLRPASPVDEISTFFRGLDQADAAIRIVGWVVLAVSAITILVGLYNSIQGRRREIAILRALGARPAHVFAVVVVEAVALCVLGGLLGLVLGHGAVALAAPWVLAEYGIRIEPALGAADALALAGLSLLGAVVGALPAFRAYRTPVAENLHPLD
jgi:putative ABC transport system permease protein